MPETTSAQLTLMAVGSNGNDVAIAGPTFRLENKQSVGQDMNSKTHLALKKNLHNSLFSFDEQLEMAACSEFEHYGGH